MVCQFVVLGLYICSTYVVPACDVLNDVVLQEYEVKDNKSTVAVTAGNKAFIFWRVSTHSLCPICTCNCSCK